MSDLSNDLHAVEDAVKAEVAKVGADGAALIEAVANDVEQVLVPAIEQAEPMIVALAVGAFNVALSTGTGGISGAFAAAESYVLSQVVADGETLADDLYIQLKTTLTSQAAKAISGTGSQNTPQPAAS